MSLDTTNNGSIKRFEHSRTQLFREHRVAIKRWAEYIKHYAWIALALCLVAALLMPALLVPCVICFMTVFFMSLSAEGSSQWLLREPLYEKSKKTRNHLTAFEKDKLGMIYLGNSQDTFYKALWFSKEDLVTHGLVLGTTGSGKTQLLLGMMNQLAALGSGFIFCDGKGDVTTWFYLYSMAKQLGLEDNVLVINFLTAGQTQSERGHKLSNTLNPFSYGSSDALMEMMSGFMGSSGNDSSMWRGRAEALGRCLLRALCELRDKKKLELSIDEIRANLPLNELEQLAEHSDLSEFAKQGIHYYFGELPGWRAYKEALLSDSKEAKKTVASAKKTAYEQHGFLMMQFTKTLEMLAGTYAHITKTDLAEVDFKDVITNRRILYVMLPSLEKSPESLKDLGRLVVTNIRNALAGLLGGDILTGEKQFLLDAKPTHADIPFGIFLDEYGSYAVEGFGDIGAQARSLNISVWFAGQEFDSFKKGSEIEASRILSNTGIKIFMKTEGDSTTQIANERAGETYVYAANQVHLNTKGLLEKTIETQDYNIHKVNRITKEDLVSQRPGECHVFFGASLWRIKAFYGDFTLSSHTHVNQFIKLKSPQKKDMSSDLIDFLNQEKHINETIEPWYNAYDEY